MSSNPQGKIVTSDQHGVYEEFQDFYEALEWLEIYVGGRYFVKFLNKIKLEK